MTAPLDLDSLFDQSLLDRRNNCDGLFLLEITPAASIKLVTFDPQYRGVMDHLGLGNEGARQKARFTLPQMSDNLIALFGTEIERVLRPSGYCMLWLDKFGLCEGKAASYLPNLQTVDLITWDKGTFGMGHRTRRTCEYLLILQKPPIRAKATWSLHNIRDCWHEKVDQARHPHQKPHDLTKALIEATTLPGDVVVNPCAGSFQLLDVCRETGRSFLGTDIETGDPS